MSENLQASPPTARRRRRRSIEARREARRAKAEREQGIVNRLNAGVSVAEIAAQEGVTHDRMRMLVREILARRTPQPPAEFLAVQIGRLSEALLVSHSAMSGGNLQAVDRVVKIVRELDRYHGFTEVKRSDHVEQRRLPAPESVPLALAAPDFSARCPDGNGAASD
jgi:hypothetical protein